MEENKKTFKENIIAFWSVKRNKIITVLVGGVLVIGIVLAIALPLGLNQGKNQDASSTSTHTHEFASTWENDESYHWHKSTCGHDVVGDKEEHTFKEQAVAATYEEEGYTLHACTVCDYSYKDNETAKLTHNYASTWSYDEEKHWHACTDEGYESLKANEAAHSYKTTTIEPTYDADGYTLYTCEVCDYSYKDDATAKLTHNYASTWSYDEEKHWHACTDEGYETLKKDEAEHTFKDVVTNPTYDAEGYTTHTCTVCGYSYVDSETSKLTHNYASTWSHDEVNHWHACTDEGYETLKKDEAEHAFKDDVIAPTFDKGGYTLHTCTVCDYSYKDNETSSKRERLGIIPVINEEKNTLTYGLYPQTHVSDEATISALDALTTAESNGWYLYNNEYYAKKSANPYKSSYTFNDETTIKSGTTYWFKCELIEWKILTSYDGSYSLVSTVLLDAHLYESYSNNYKNSDIRSWLNNGFLNTAFNLESSYIQTTTVDNSASTTDSSSNEYACDNTSDKVYLLSYQDYLNADYGFTISTSKTATRTCKPTDYALANYCYQYDGNGFYWTRSPASSRSSNAWFVSDGGNLTYSGNSVNNASFGVRPAITIKL